MWEWKQPENLSNTEIGCYQVFLGLFALHDKVCPVKYADFFCVTKQRQVEGYASSKRNVRAIINSGLRI